MRSTCLAGLALALIPAVVSAQAASSPPRPDRIAFRALCEELVETNTTLSSGSCTAAAGRMADRRKAAGFADADLYPFAAPGHPAEGGLVAVLTNPGGHSSRPSKDNAIYHLAGGLVRISQYDFPLEYADAKAAAVVETEAGYNGMLHTTCASTMLDGGHAANALPQRARANIYCRIFPGTTAEQVRDKLEELIADPKVKVAILDARSEVTKTPPPLTPQIMKPIDIMAAKIGPGVPIIPVLTAGATDRAFLSPAGIPTYGVSGIFGDPDGNGVHGLNERIRGKLLYDGRDFLCGLVKVYSMQS